MLKTIILIAGFAIFYGLEKLRPFFPHPRNDWIRVLRNIGLSLANALLGRLIFSGETLWAIEGLNFGLLDQLVLDAWVKFFAGFLLLDLWTYWWHRFNHTIPILWRFHAVHHSDEEMDASTALRFHPVEIVLSSLARIPLFALLGIDFWTLATYEAVLAASTLFQHANIALPSVWDRRLSWVIVTPTMHKVHHSREEPDHESNFTSIFSWWDRMFLTWKFEEHPETLELGLAQALPSQKKGLVALLAAPFRPTSSARN